MDEISCRIIELPPRVNAVTVVDENGDFNVYVNSRLSREEQVTAYDHERSHIIKNHFYRQKSVSQCEWEAKRP